MNNYATKFLHQIVNVKVDRALGTKHHKHNIYYSFNYGFIPGELAPDGEEVDAYILGVFEPVAEFTGRCIAIIHRLDDDDDKLIVVPDGVNYSDEQILALVEFQERFFKPTVLR
jgi:inorganic pyrophosphatase